MRIERGMSYKQRFAVWKSDSIAFGVVIRKAQIASGVLFLRKSPKRGNVLEAFVDRGPFVLLGYLSCLTCYGRPSSSRELLQQPHPTASAL